MTSLLQGRGGAHYCDNMWPGERGGGGWKGYICGDVVNGQPLVKFRKITELSKFFQIFEYLKLPKFDKFNEIWYLELPNYRNLLKLLNHGNLINLLNYRNFVKLPNTRNILISEFLELPKFRKITRLAQVPKFIKITELPKLYTKI